MPRNYKPKRLKRSETDPTTIRGAKTSEVSVRALPDFFDHLDAGGKERWVHDVEILVVEWAFFFPNHKPYEFLTGCKGYSDTQATGILKLMPASEWPSKRQAALDKTTEGLIRRHVDKMAEVQDQHISASKLGLAQALKMLAGGSTEPFRDADGKPLKDKAGNIRFKQFRSIDLVNCMTAIEKAQQVYRRAMGLPNEEGGLNQILQKIEKMQELRHHQTLNVQINNNTINTVPAEEGQKTPADMSYDDIMLIIEAKREQKAKLLEAPIDERLKIEPKETTPTGDFTANPRASR